MEPLMKRLGAAPIPPESLFPLALTAAAVIAAIEFPISKFYSTTPATTTAKRMAIAGGMAFVAVLVAGAFLRKKE
jgi:hypothetical protein